jgi:hypothetical protein
MGGRRLAEGDGGPHLGTITNPIARHEDEADGKLLLAVQPCGLEPAQAAPRATKSADLTGWTIVVGTGTALACRRWMTMVDDPHPDHLLVRPPRPDRGHRLPKLSWRSLLFPGKSGVVMMGVFAATLAMFLLAAFYIGRH